MSKNVMDYSDVVPEFHLFEQDKENATVPACLGANPAVDHGTPMDCRMVAFSSAIARLRERAELAKQEKAKPPRWIKIAVFAEIANISQVAACKVARRASIGKRWHGADIIVRERVGRGGIHHEIALGSLPAALQDIYASRYMGAVQ